ncbi:unnamed protein product [Mytilus edulis]|uniref:Homeobox domain-containing protein n=1 Tax=Mytilus edulis TaxID=6550 RepID=A0A8S3QF94_MYTED|nr:unnamed protein product [Mytilus edulis]
MQEKILQYPCNDNNSQVEQVTMPPTEQVDNRPIPQISLKVPTPTETSREKMTAFLPPVQRYFQSYNGEHTQESARQQTDHSMLYLMTSQNRPKTPPSMTFLTPSRISGPIMTAYQTPPTRHMLKQQKRKASPSDGESERSCEEDEIDVVNDRKSPDNNREIDSSMSTNNTSVLESPSTGSSNNSSPASISTHSPLSSDSSVKKKVRTNYSPSQVQALEKIFHENPYPEPETMEMLASDLNIPEAKIKVWFQNKRARWRRRAAENPHPAYMTPMSPMMSPMHASYGMVPHHHPMLHGSPAQMVPGPFFYPNQAVGTPGPHSVPSHHFGTPGQTVPSTPVSNGSPASTTSSTTSPASTSDNQKQSPHMQMTPPYQHRLPPHFSPYMPFSYPYGMCPPYYC